MDLLRIYRRDSDVEMCNTDVYSLEPNIRADIIRIILMDADVELCKVDVMSFEPSTRTDLLIFAVKDKSIKCVRELIRQGIDVSAASFLKNRWGSPTFKHITALHAAAEVGDVECVVLLISAGANINATTYENVTPLSLAIKNKHDACVALFLVLGCKFIDGYENNLLYSAIGYDFGFKALIIAGISVKYITYEHMCLAIKKEHFAAFRLMYDLYDWNETYDLLKYSINKLREPFIEAIMCKSSTDELLRACIDVMNDNCFCGCIKCGGEYEPDETFICGCMCDDIWFVAKREILKKAAIIPRTIIEDIFKLV